jgi:hypothetical protein
MQKSVKNVRCLDSRGAWSRFFILLVCLALPGFRLSSQAQNSLNVTNYGAVGDAVQFFVNTVSNSVIITTTSPLSSADIGKAIEVFRVGAQTAGVDSYGNTTNGNQDLVATITNVVDGTNIYVSKIAQATLTSTFATYGHNNQTNFQNAIAAATGTNFTINIPAGKYLFISTYVPKVYGFCGMVLSRGGIHFVGAGTNATTLLDQGAWTLQSVDNPYPVTRGFLVVIVPPITNDYPVSFENLTLDGGVQQGNTPIHGAYPNLVDGQGWDISHDAIVIRGGSTGNVFTQQTWTNVVFTHWRGEMVKSNDGSTNGNLSIFNCVFNDGDATAINYYASLNVSNCVFNNLFQIAEYYQAYSTNISYFQDNFVTNITGNGFALNGGKGNNPPFVLENNTFYFPGNGYNAIETTPADNVSIVSNQFVFNGGNAIVLGCAGYQGTCDNSNIVIAGNSFVNPSIILEICGATDATGANRVEDVQLYGNSLTQTAPATPNVVRTYGWSTNVSLYNNDFTNVSCGSATCISGVYGGQYALIKTNNLYFTEIYDLTGKTNSISYGNGSRFEVIYGFHQGTVYSLVDTNATQMPAGAMIELYNNNTSSAAVPVYLNCALTRGPVMVSGGQTATFYWNQFSRVWSTNTVPDPPSNLRSN